MESDVMNSPTTDAAKTTRRGRISDLVMMQNGHGYINVRRIDATRFPWPFIGEVSHPFIELAIEKELEVTLHLATRTVYRIDVHTDESTRGHAEIDHPEGGSEGPEEPPVADRKESGTVKWIGAGVRLSSETERVEDVSGRLIFAITDNAFTDLFLSNSQPGDADMIFLVRFAARHGWSINVEAAEDGMVTKVHLPVPMPDA